MSTARARHLMLVAAVVATLAGCGPVAADPEPEGDADTSAVSPTQAPPEATTPSPAAEPSQPAAQEPPRKPNMSVTFIGEIDWPPLPPLPPVPAADAPPGGLLTVAGGWEMHYEMPAEQLHCAALGPDGSLQTAPQYVYGSRTHPVEARQDEELEMTVQLVRAPHEASISSDIEITWKEPGELRARGLTTPPCDPASSSNVARCKYPLTAALSSSRS